MKSLLIGLLVLVGQVAEAKMICHFMCVQRWCGSPPDYERGDITEEVLGSGKNKAEAEEVANRRCDARRDANGCRPDSEYIELSHPGCYEEATAKTYKMSFRNLTNQTVVFTLNTGGKADPRSLAAGRISDFAMKVEPGKTPVVSIRQPPDNKKSLNFTVEDKGKYDFNFNQKGEIGNFFRPKINGP